MKTSRLLLTLTAAVCLAWGGEAAAGTVNATLSSRATVRDGTSVDTDIDEATLGYVMAKYSTTGSGAKGYFEFNLAGLNPNTGAAATFTVRRASNSGAHHVKLWALNQAYPGMADSLTWNTAQANDTANNDLLTSGSFTATPLEDRLIAGGVGNVDFTLPAPWGQFLHNDRIVLVLAGVDDAGNNTAGFRVTLTNAPLTPRLTFSDTTGNLAPTITPTTNQTLYAHHVSAAILFTVGDDTTPAASIDLFATSSDSAVVPASSFVYTGQGVSGSRTVTFTAGAAGSATVTVFVSDGSATNFTQFGVTVLPDPSLSTPPATNTLAGTPVTVAFTVGDVDVGPNSLTATGASGNLKVVADAGISTGGSGADRTVTVTPLAGRDGVAVIHLTVSDGTYGTMTSFPVMSLPSASVCFAEHFDYPAGSLNAMSAGFWAFRTGGSVVLRTTNQQALIRSTTSGESLVARLAGGPYTTGVLFYGFRAKWTALPGNSAAEFIHLYDPSGPYRVGRVYTLTNSTGPGLFRLGAANIGSPVEFTTDLTTNVTYRIVVRYDIDGNLNGGFITTRLWVDPADEASTSVDALDSTAPVSITQVGLRQNADMGTILVDDLKVGLSFADVLPPVLTPTQPRITGYALGDARFQIDFTAGPDDSPADFAVLNSTNVAGPYLPASNPRITVLAPGVFRASPPLSGSEGFYQVAR